MNAQGEKFLNRVREIIEECSKLESPRRAAHVTAFAIMVMLDGSRESIGTQYVLTTEDGEIVEFLHYEL